MKSNPYDGSETLALPAEPPSGPTGDVTLTFAGQGPRPELGDAQLPVIDGYEIQKELGRGGMGVVYLARQTTLNREVALKMVISGGQASAADRTRFLAEAELAAGLRHPGIVQIHEFGTFNGQPFFALEYCPNGSLAAKLNGQPMSATPSAELIVSLADAIDVAHQNGIVHRDLKPGNILLAADGSPKITDFGLARRGDSSQGLTATGAILGTPGYMAPEQAEGNASQIGPATDVYALGSIFYECLTGRPPFRAATAMDTVMQVVREEPVPPSRLSPRIPRDLETICLKCLRKDPAKRYARASELADDLRRFLHGEPITARPVSKLERFWKLLKRHPAISGGTFMIVLALIAVTGVVAVKNRQLGRERDNALRSEQEALAEQQKNQRLVDVAIDQQERLIARITSVDWTGNRALVAERERILQDVAEFYKQLLRQEVDDPIVRRKNAEAHVRLALVQIHRSDYRAAADSIQLAKQSLEQLSESFADDPDTISALAKTETAVGHLWMLQGELLIGSEHYHRAVELAEKAVSIRPDREDDKMLLMECYLSLVQYYSQTDTANATLYSDKISALSIGIDLDQKPSYQSRLILLAGLFQKAQSLSLKRDFSKAVKVLDEASAILEKLLLEDAPSVRSREITEQFAASLLASRGILRLRTDKSESAKKEAVGHLQDSVARYDRALAGNPKSIPFQIARLTALMQYAVVQEQIGDEAGAVKTHRQLDAAAKKMQSDHPKMVWLNNIAAVSRSVLLVNQSNESNLENFEAKAKAILDIKESGPQMSSAKYNVACAYSLASKKVSEQDKERYQAKAVEILETIRVAGYFSIPNRVADIKKDTDFDPIRARDDFKTVLKKVAGEK